MNDPLAARPLTRSPVVGLLWLYALVAAPHLWHLSPLLMALFFLALVWRALALRHPGLMPGRWVRGLLTFGGLAAVLVSVAGQLDGRALGVGLLTVMAGLKLLELHGRRDLYVLVFLGCFLLATQFLFDRGLWLSLYLTPLLLGLLSLLALINRAGEPDWRTALRDTGRLLLAGLPMALLLFVLFPRLAEPLWGLSSPGHGVSGLTDQLQPGSIARLSLSRAVAFRVSFAGERPAASELYWRGPVFWNTDGRTWTAAKPLARRPAPVAGDGRSWRQQVTLEPTNQYWLFGLDRVVEAPEHASLSRDGQLLGHQPVRQRRNYRVTSVIGASEPELSTRYRRRTLTVPESVPTARLEALVNGWRAAADGDAGVVAAALAHFREQDFVYTLQPPPLPDNPLDGFLFETRRGFCEHYATSFVLLMRLAGIPARVVGGYQGGEWNPRGEHYVVRQSDAHAWAEVWLAGRGWQRVDPTAAVAPERIERPIAAGGAAGEPVAFQVPAGGLFARLWREGVWLVDAMELGWQRWVVDYSERSQANLLRGLGLGFLSGYRLALGAVFAAVLAMLPLWWLLRRQRAAGGDPALRAYRQLQAKLRQAGLVVPESLPPSELGRRAGARFPERRIEIARLVGVYLRARYGPGATGAEARRLKQRVRRLRLRARR